MKEIESLCGSSDLGCSERNALFLSSQAYRAYSRFYVLLLCLTPIGTELSPASESSL